MLVQESGRLVHTPADPAVFAFDAEVARIFPDMAERSIPNYRRAHELHVAMAYDLLSIPGCKVLDVGASRGAFYNHILSAGHLDVGYVAVDYSAPMIEMLRKEFPAVRTECADIRTDEFSLWLEANGPFDIVCCNYVLQFIPPQQQGLALAKLASAVKDGGLFFLGQKSSHSGVLGENAHRKYIDWRVSNGYSREEIEAKTAALKGSMWPACYDDVLDGLLFWFREVQETTRFLMFNTIAARK